MGNEVITMDLSGKVRRMFHRDKLSRSEIARIGSSRRKAKEGSLPDGAGAEPWFALTWRRESLTLTQSVATYTLFGLRKSV